jgi:hypothetical protein
MVVLGLGLNNLVASGITTSLARPFPLLAMKLIDIDSRQEIQVNETRKLFNGGTAVVKSWTEPHKPSSTGRVYVERDGQRMEYFPRVIGAEFVRDRPERSQEPDQAKKIPPKLASELTKAIVRRANKHYPTVGTGKGVYEFQGRVFYNKTDLREFVLEWCQALRLEDVQTVNRQYNLP